jgi:hypothetical protein
MGRILSVVAGFLVALCFVGGLKLITAHPVVLLALAGVVILLICGPPAGRRRL